MKRATAAPAPPQYPHPGSAMRYVMRQKILALGDDFNIRDEEGRDVYLVDGRAFSLGSKLAFRDMAGTELAFIRQKLLTWGPTYEIHRDGKLVAVVKKKLFSFFHHHFTVDVPGPDDLEAEGDFTDHEYEFRRGERVVATVSKRWFSWTDTYGIEIAPGEDDVLVLASAVVVDLACHPAGQQH
jgi:uncharacterized protein YxjI